jgi:hypothetical protein
MRELTIDIRIAKDGRSTMHVSGAQGESCTKLTEAVEKRLGVVEHREYTPERENAIHESLPNQQKVRRT